MPSHLAPDGAKSSDEAPSTSSELTSQQSRPQVSGSLKQHQQAQAPGETIGVPLQDSRDEQDRRPAEMADTEHQWSNGRIEVDSAIGSAGDFLSSTTSLRSSVYESVEEFGRTYHAYKSGKYNLPNDEKEQDRLDLQHAVCMEIFGHRLAVAPIEQIPLHNALDIATGTGVWAIDFADAHPSCSVLGTDLSPIQPPHVPPNCRFLVDDAEDDWLFRPGQRFDYIHARAVFTCFRDPRRVIRSAIDALAPGGILEIQDPAFPLSFADPQPPPDSPAVRWLSLVAEVGQKTGHEWVNCYEYREWFQREGLVDVHVEPFFSPIGPWRNDDDRLRRIGGVQLHNWLEAVEAVSPRMLEKLGWEIEEIKVLVAQVRAEFLSGKLRAWTDVVSTWGRKPQAASTTADTDAGAVVE